MKDAEEITIHGLFAQISTTWAYDCEIVQGREPNYEDDSCESYWECEDYNGTLTRCTQDDQFDFKELECLPNSEVWCQWQHLRLQEPSGVSIGGGSYLIPKQPKVLHVHHVTLLKKDDSEQPQINAVGTDEHEHPQTPTDPTSHTHLHTHADGTTHSHPHTHDGDLDDHNHTHVVTHHHPHTHADGTTHSHPHTHDGDLDNHNHSHTHIHPHTHADGTTHSHPHTHDGDLEDHDHSHTVTHTHPHTHADGTTHSHPHTHDGDLDNHNHSHTHIHPHTHADGTTHSHPHTHDGDLSDHDHSHTVTHTQPHTHADGTTHSHPHTHTGNIEVHDHAHADSNTYPFTHAALRVSSDYTAHPETINEVPGHRHDRKSQHLGMVYDVMSEVYDDNHISGHPGPDYNSEYDYKNSNSYDYNYEDVKTWGYVCMSEYGHEPNLADSACRSHWRCDKYKGSKIYCKPGHEYDIHSTACRADHLVDCHGQLTSYKSSGPGHHTQLENRDDGVTVVHHFYHQGFQPPAGTPDIVYSTEDDDYVFHDSYHSDGATSATYGDLVLAPHTEHVDVTRESRTLEDLEPAPVASLLNPFSALGVLLKSTRNRNTQNLTGDLENTVGTTGGKVSEGIDVASHIIPSNTLTPRNSLLPDASRNSSEPQSTSAIPKTSNRRPQHRLNRRKNSGRRLRVPTLYGVRSGQQNNTANRRKNGVSRRRIIVYHPLRNESLDNQPPQAGKATADPQTDGQSSPADFHANISEISNETVNDEVPVTPETSDNAQPGSGQAPGEASSSSEQNSTKTSPSPSQATVDDAPSALNLSNAASSPQTSSISSGQVAPSASATTIDTISPVEPSTTTASTGGDNDNENGDNNSTDSTVNGTPAFKGAAPARIVT